MSTQEVCVVLDPHGSSLRGPQGVDPKQVGQRTVMDCDVLRDLQEPDQFQTVQSLGTGLVAVDSRSPRMHGGVGRDDAIDVGTIERTLRLEPLISAAACGSSLRVKSARRLRGDPRACARPVGRARRGRR